VYY
jgi:hypothetical protein